MLNYLSINKYFKKISNCNRQPLVRLFFVSFLSLCAVITASKMVQFQNKPLAPTAPKKVPAQQPISNPCKTYFYAYDVIPVPTSAIKFPTSILTPVITPTRTMTPTVAITLTPTPTIVPSCFGLDFNKNVITPQEKIAISVRVSHYGILRYGKCPNQSQCRVIDTLSPQTLASGYQNINLTFPSANQLLEPGIYVFEVNAYESNKCRYLCSSMRWLYENTLQDGGFCETRGHWQFTNNNCQSNNCIQWLTVNP